MRRFAWLGGLGVLLCTPAFAESRGLVEAERAYQAVDFPATRALAKQAIEAGGADREQMARLYVLLGISAAAQGDAEEAKTDFVVALAVKPSLKLDKGLAPKVRDPYLEAQGYWAAASDRLTLNARPTTDQAHLVIQLSDPAALVSKLELRLARSGTAPRPVFAFVAAPTTRFTLPTDVRGQSYEYTLRALDRFGNVLAERGSDADPELVRVGSTLETEKVDAGTASAQPGRSYLLPIALGVAGLGAVSAGVAFQVKRENAAQDWNGASCEQPGQTRLQQCQDVDERRQKYEHLAIGFYAAGGALLTGSVIALIAGRPAPNSRLRAGLLGCGWAAMSVTCEGRF